MSKPVILCRICGRELIKRSDCRGKRLCGTHQRFSTRNPVMFRYMLDVAEGRAFPNDTHAKDFDRVRLDRPLLKQWDALAAKMKPRKDTAVRHFWR